MVEYLVGIYRSGSSLVYLTFTRFGQVVCVCVQSIVKFIWIWIVHCPRPVLFCPIFCGHQYVYDISVHSLNHTLGQLCCRVFVLRFWQASLFLWMSALKFINTSYQQKNSTKQRLHNNENLGYIMYQKLFQIQRTNKANQFWEHCQHSVSHGSKALRTLLTKHPAKKNYKEPTSLETNSKKTPYLRQRPSILIRNFNTEFGKRTPKSLEWKLRMLGRRNPMRLGYEHQTL